VKARRGQRISFTYTNPSVASGGITTRLSGRGLRRVEANSRTVTWTVSASGKYLIYIIVEGRPGFGTFAPKTFVVQIHA
jgi:hypothetical protein